jgi:DNA-binding CsgD family transcriptional regulator/tetratricopeptide (TPR) repeat protein
VAVLVGLRAERRSPFLRAGFEQLELVGVDEPTGQAILDGAGGRHVSPDVARALTRATGGNPLALIELHRHLSDAQLDGSEPLPEVLPASGTIAASFAQRLASLDTDERTALLVAAASDSTSVDVVSRAIELLGLDPAGLDAAESADLVEIADLRVSFRHPLVRTVMYGSASARERREVHVALGDAFAATGDDERAAWHRAMGTLHPDEAVARELAEAAASARRRSGYRAAARALELSARLTPDPELRAQRLLDASSAARRAAGIAWSLRLAQGAAALTGEPRVTADIELGRAVTTYLAGDARGAVRIAEQSADAVERHDPARTARLLSYSASWSMALGDTRAGVASASRAYDILRRMGETDADMPLTVIEALAGLLLLRGETDEGRRLLDVAVERHTRLDDLTGSEFAAQFLIWLEEYERAAALLEPLARQARRAGNLTTLAQVLESLATLQLRVGRWQQAYASASESLELAIDTDLTIQIPYSLSILAQVEAATGREQDCRDHAARALAMDRGSGIVLEYAGAALGLLELARGDPAAALGQLEPVDAHVRQGERVEPAVFFWPADLVEAYIVAGRRDEASAALARLQQHAQRTGRAWALAVAARLHALLAEDEVEAEGWFAEAMRRHEASPTPFERARTQLDLGDWQRRHRQRVEARRQLREALAVFERLGAPAWAERARRSLRASGETLARPDASGVDSLTGQELQIAMLVAEGATNREVAARLFLSPKTIETHLSRIYRKLDVRSRGELGRRLPMIEAPASA